jgi:hypothetical protein
MNPTSLCVRLSIVLASASLAGCLASSQDPADDEPVGADQALLVTPTATAGPNTPGFLLTAYGGHTFSKPGYGFPPAPTPTPPGPGVCGTPVPSPFGVPVAAPFGVAAPVPTPVGASLPAGAPFGFGSGHPCGNGPC